MTKGVVEMKMIRSFGVYGMDLFISDDELDGAEVVRITAGSKNSGEKELDQVVAVEIRLKEPVIHALIGENGDKEVEDSAENLIKIITDRIAKCRRSQMKVLP